MANDPGKEILEFFAKLIIYTVGETIGFFIFIENYSKIEGVKDLLLAIAAFLFCLMYLYKKAKSNKKRYLVLSIAFIIAIFIVILGDSVHSRLTDLYKDPNIFLFNLAMFVIISIILLKLLNVIFKKIDEFVET